MENLSTYLPDTNAATLEPFFKAYDDDCLAYYIVDHVREVASNIEGATEEQILTDISNLDTAIRGFYDDVWEEQDAAIRQEDEDAALQQDY